MSRKFLNIGGGTKDIPVPAFFDNWEHHLLDIKQMDGKEKPDFLMDSRTLKFNTDLKGIYDAVYCSHNLEHYYRGDLSSVLAGIYHVLQPTGFAFIRVPDVVGAIQDMVEKGLEFHDLVRPEHPQLHYVQYHDIIYGRDSFKDINPTQSHRQAFTINSLCTGLKYAGFKYFYSSERKEDMEFIVIAFINPPLEEYKYMLSLD